MPMTPHKFHRTTAESFADGWRFCETKTANASAEHVDFGVVDAKGRTLGAIVIKSESTVTIFDDEPHDARQWGAIRHRDDAGLWYRAKVQAAKNGASFGASQAGDYFRTEAERDAYVARRLADSRKAAEKKAAR